MRIPIVILAAAVVLGVPAVVLAASGGANSSLDLQRSRFTTTTATTSSRTFQRLVPAGPHDSFSFTFVNSVGPFEANDNHSFDVEWRSPTGAATTLERGTFNLRYQRGTQQC